MKTKHTPGPWQFYADLPSTEPNWHIVTNIVTNASRMRILANVYIEPGNRVDLANARLISLAPEMAEALRLMVDMFERHIDGRPGPDDAAARWDNARAILAKLDGKE